MVRQGPQLLELGQFHVSWRDEDGSIYKHTNTNNICKYFQTLAKINGPSTLPSARPIRSTARVLAGHSGTQTPRLEPVQAQAQPTSSRPTTRTPIHFHHPYPPDTRATKPPAWSPCGVHLPTPPVSSPDTQRTRHPALRLCSATPVQPPENGPPPVRCTFGHTTGPNVRLEAARSPRNT